MNPAAKMDLSTWQGMRTRDPRRLTLGTTRWGIPCGIGNRGGQPDAPEIAAILARAKTAGMNSIDTARAWGESESRIGVAIRDDEHWRVMTKLDPKTHHQGLGIAETLEAVSKSLDASRRALQTDVLPVLMLHRFAHRHACGGRLWRTLLAERDAGRIGSLGISAATPEEAWAALEDPDIEILEVASSLLDLRLHRQGFFPRARELGRRIYVHSIFVHGVAHLDADALPRELHNLVGPMRLIQASAERVGVSVDALLLAFARDLPGVHPILGCESDAQLEARLASWTSDAVDAATISLLVDALPTLEANVLDPSCWPDEGLSRRSPTNQTDATSIATMRT